MRDPLADARALLASAARFHPGRRKPVIALVRFGGEEVLVLMYDDRELISLRKLVKNLNARVTVRKLETISVATAKEVAWLRLMHLQPFPHKWQLRQYPQVLEAIAHCND